MWPRKKKKWKMAFELSFFFLILINLYHPHIIHPSYHPHIIHPSFTSHPFEYKAIN